MAFFRIGAIVLIITSGLHMIGHVQGLNPEGEKQELLVELMQNVEFQAGSEYITIMNLYVGFSLCFALLFLWTGANALFLSIRLRDDVRLIKTYALIYVIMLSIGTTISYNYFFSAPTSCFALALVLFAISYFRLKEPKTVIHTKS